MKTLKYLILSLAILSAGISCKDESLDPFIRPEGAVHGFGQFVSPTGTLLPDPSLGQFYSQSSVDAVVFYDDANIPGSSINYKLQWIALDNKKTVESIDLYLEFNEVYTDEDRNPKTAIHGGLESDVNPTKPDGKFWKTITSPGNRQTVDITVTPNDVYTLYQNATFDYNGDGTPEPVFGDNSLKFARDRSSKRFYKSEAKNYGQGTVTLGADIFRIRWRLKTTDGLYFGTWGNSVCTEFVGANCFGQWKVK